VGRGGQTARAQTFSLSTRRHPPNLFGDEVLTSEKRRIDALKPDGSG